MPRVAEKNMHPLTTSYPFAAIVGQENAKRALMLLSVDRSLKGALISSSSGTAKSALARAFQSLLFIETPPAPFIEMPLNVTEDRLIGGIDIELALSTGERRMSLGLLAEAHGGALYVDDINLIETFLVGLVASALDSGEVRIEREGISAKCPADFLLIGAYNPAEREVSPLLRHRVGLIVAAEPVIHIEDRAEIISRVARYQEDPRSFIEEYAIETATILSAIEEARALLPEVRISTDYIRQIAQLSLSLGVEGNLADIIATRAARANAALAGQLAVGNEDIFAALELVLLPRATRMPDVEEGREEKGNSNNSDPPENEGPGDDKSEMEKFPLALDDLIVQAIDARLPDDLLTVRGNGTLRGTSGKRANSSDASRGRYIRSVARPRAGKVAIDATLRAAAPFQLSRRKGRGSRIKLAEDDLRYKRFKRRSGMLFIFAVDASGSMAMNRMAQAKGAMSRLLQKAYLHRDKVALISFRDESADLLLSPTRSVELAGRLIDAMPSGGATPMAAGLMRAIEIARLARSQDISQSMLLVFTDGRANVALRNDLAAERRERFEIIRDELKQIGTIMASEDISVIVIDTSSRHVSGGVGRALAELIGGKYAYLPRADSEAIYEAVASAAEIVRVET